MRVSDAGVYRSGSRSGLPHAADFSLAPQTRFLPAVFARRTGAAFYKKTGIQVKLTSLAYRYDGNKPDDFEQEVLKILADPKTPKGQIVSRSSMVNGKPALRVMKPEYAGASCLNCHGSPKGDKDITGMRKEGWSEGDLAGAISVIMPAR